LEGSVKVSVGEESRVLAPGQQAIVVVGLQANNDNPNIKVVDHIDTDAVVAWKEGQFQFSGADMSAIFNTVARWYDVKVINHTNISEHLVFSVSRDVSLSVFMRALERTNHLHYRIEGKTLIVEP